MKLVNKELAGKKLVSAHAMLEFDAEGVAVKPELSEDLMKAFAELPGFEIVEEDKKEKAKPEAPEKKPTAKEKREAKQEKQDKE